jgi:endonuclease/exonuclease/phosphatase family metal-dependent hydrolase
MNTQTTPHSAWRRKLRGPTGLFGVVACLFLLTGLLASAVPDRAGEKCPNDKRGFDTMTVNLYVGTGTENITALDPTDPNYLVKLVTAVTGVYYQVLASQPPVRLQGVADRVAARMPDVVAVEEATLVRIQSPGDIVEGGTTPATEVVFDYVQILVDALQARGAHYAVASTSVEWDIEMPMFELGPDGNPTGVIDDVRQTDREAILVRTDLAPGQLRVSHPQSGHFTNLLVYPSLGFAVTRGWCSVDLCARGDNFRYVCTHLEEETYPQLQVLQTQELLAGPVRTPLPVVLVGDFNSDPLHRDRPLSELTAYPKIIGAGFRDTWAVLHPFHPAAGLTWGHDEFLADPNVLFDRRIDFVFFRGPGFVPVKAEPIDMVLNRAQPPLWASDHAALAAELLIEPVPCELHRK